MDLSKEVVLQRLKDVIDPEVNLNIVDMGLVYGIHIENQNVKVEMTLTTQGCPMKDYMQGAVTAAVGTLEGAGDVEVEFVWTPPWTPDKINQEAFNQRG